MPEAPTRASGRTARTTTAALLEQARIACDLARRAGADDAVAAVERSRGLDFAWRDGRLESVTEDASRALVVALYLDGRYSTHATNDLEPGRLARFLDDAVHLTRHLEPDPHRRIPDPALYAGRSDVDLDLVDPAVSDLSREARVDWLKAMTERARDHADVISSTSQVFDEHRLVGRASTNGFEGTHESTVVFYGATSTIRDGETRRPEASFHVGGTHRDALPGPEEVGRETLSRVLARRGAKKARSGRSTLVLHPEAGAPLIRRLLGPLSAGAVQQGHSFLADRQDERIASPLLDVVDDPLVPRGLASHLFDGEGIASRRRTLVEEGVLRTFYVDTYYGRKLGWAPTTGSPSNLRFRLGAKGLADLLRDVGDGVLVTSWLGGNANATTGDFSFGVRGHLVRGGEIREPIGETNATGNYLDLLRHLVAVGNDPRPWMSCQTPTLVFEGVQLSGD